MSTFECQDWTTSEFGHIFEEDSKPERLSDLPAPRCVGFTVRGETDADHDTDVVARRNMTGFTMCLNSFSVHWFSKKKNIVESSSFTSKFTAMKQACEHSRGFKNKLK